MRAEPFTPCKLRVAPWPDAHPFTAEDEGAFMYTASGSAYRIDRVRGRTLHCTRWPLAEIPEDALVFEWVWSQR